MDIKTGDYSVEYDSANSTITCQGSFRLSGMEEYAPVVQLLDAVAEQNPPSITLNLRHLEFLNSSGINVLSKFMIKMRQKPEIQVILLGSKKIPWQGKSLKNLQRLMPSLLMEWE
ncbi:hypothetical protein BegalDRAFT_2121 [Beggiatoa alba B18LD]|uniref:STAS domain-containing protein n=1 Tax=Beggiatoa alba B18LD TaxID=395493 RepID=I3CH93_9GAMM|nr:hypothetical protein [Beggiatoa alba]EIJ42986.1 hypothetical protein BegalDRAFT_2121 [Beggiatoa alba B18LD]